MSVKEIKLPGLTGNLSALKFGNESGKAIICLHGWLDNAASFQPLSESMSECHWICLELPGHGRSDYRPQGCIYHYTDYIADVHLAIEALRIENFILLGHSLGAGLVAAYSAMFPEKVHKLILIDGIGPISGEDDDTLKQMRNSMRFLNQKPQDQPRLYTSWEGLINRRLEAGHICRSSAQVLLERGSKKEGDKIRVLSDGRLKQHSPIYMSQGKVLSILRGIEAESLLIIASQGLVHGRKSTRDRISAFKNLTVKNIEGAHHVHMDEPQGVADLIKSFIEGERQNDL